MSKVYVKDVHDKDAVKSVFQVAKKTQTVSKGGKPFLAVVLRDKTGELDARIWERIEELGPKFDAGDLVSVEGVAITFQGRPQLRIDAAEKHDGAGIDPADFAAPPKTGPGERAFGQIGELIDRIQDPPTRALCRSFLDDEAIAGDFKRAPAAKSVHHARPGGLAEHTLSVMRLALKLTEHYPMVDRDLVVAGAFLHDLAKVRELSYERGTEYTDSGRLVGHLVMIAQWIHARGAQIEGFTPALEAHLCHIVLSHHGTLEFGSPRLPQTLEAVLVHYVDELDSRMAGWLEVMQRDPNEHWTDYQKLYDRHLFKGPTPTVHAKVPVERRHRGEKKRRERAERHGAPGAEGAAHAPEEKKAEGGAEAAARPERPERPARAERPERRERPGRKEKPEEKLTFKPFAALTPTAPEEPPPAPPAEAKPEEAAPESAPQAAPAPEEG